jgi:hypothetical protein
VIRRALSILLGVMMLASFVAACSISGDDDDDNDSPTVTEAPQPAVSPTPTTVASPTETAASTERPTSTPEPTPTATSTSTATPEPTPTPTATPTATPIPIVDAPFANAPTLDSVLENYTVTYNGEFENPDGSIESIAIFVEQSNPTHYHLKVGTDVEIWFIEAATYFRNPADGSVFLIPSAVDPGLVSPAAYLIQVPNPEKVPQALSVGTEDVGGRPATHYSVTADQIDKFGLVDDQTVNDPEGDVDIWVDQELGFISQMKMDVDWTDETGTRQSAVLDLLISNVGSTAEIVAPI